MMEYKKTKIDWCPYIPCDWQEIRVKDIARLQSGSNLTANDIDELGDYPVYGGNGLRGYTNNYTNEGSHVLIGRQGALCGNINYAHGKFYATEHAVVVYPFDKLLNTKWLGETMRCANFNRLSASAAQPGLAVSVINNQFLPYPPKEVRDRIADYLDEKTKAIDARISVLEKKSDAYTRLKASVINRAVTRGLNPNVTLKDSGIEWIGMIPEHWEVKRLSETTTGAINSFIDGDWIESSDISNEGIRYLTSGNVGSILYKEQGNGYITEDTFQRLNCHEVYSGDILISRLNPPIGRCCLVPELNTRVVTCVDNVIYRPNIDKYIPKFMVYMMNCHNYSEWLTMQGRGATMKRISRTALAKVKLIIPPLSEQQSIATYLDTKCSEIDKAIDNIGKQIEALKRLKRSLINEVVTGKRKV